jgi:hypothetical protein
MNHSFSLPDVKLQNTNISISYIHTSIYIHLKKSVGTDFACFRKVVT